MRPPVQSACTPTILIELATIVILPASVVVRSPLIASSATKVWGSHGMAIHAIIPVPSVPLLTTTTPTAATVRLCASFAKIPQRPAHPAH